MQIDLQTHVFRYPDTCVWISTPAYRFGSVLYRVSRGIHVTQIRPHNWLITSCMINEFKNHKRPPDSTRSRKLITSTTFDFSTRVTFNSRALVLHVLLVERVCGLVIRSLKPRTEKSRSYLQSPIFSLFVIFLFLFFAEIVLRRHRSAQGIFKIGPVELSKKEALFPFPPKGRTNERDRSDSSKS